MKENVVTVHPSDISMDTINQEEYLALGYSSRQQAEGAANRSSWLNARVENKVYGSSRIESPKTGKNGSLAFSNSSARSLREFDRVKVERDNDNTPSGNKVEIDINQLFNNQNNHKESDKSRRESTQVVIPTNLVIPEDQIPMKQYLKKSTHNQTSVFNEGEMIRSLQTNNNLNYTFTSNNNIKQNNLNKKRGKSTFFSLFNFKIMKEIVAHIKNHVLSRKFTDLSKKNFTLINDLAALTHEGNQSKWVDFLKCMVNWIPRVPVFSSDSPLFVAWNVTIFFTIIFQVLMIPLEVSFKVSFGSSDFFLGLAYVVEMLTNFNSSYFEEGIAVHDRKKIIFNYCSEQFWLDLLTSLAFFFNTDHKIFVLDLIFMIRISNIPNIFKEIEQFFQFYRHQALIDLITLLFWTALMAHYLGCGFHYISISGSHSWIKQFDIDDSDWFVRYVYCIYFSFVTMSTIGYGDIYPVSVEEKIYVIAMLIIGSGWFAYVVNKAGQIFSEIQFQKKKVSEKQYLILDYMRNRNVSKNLQLKVVKYLDFVDSKESEDSSHGEKILETMSSDLKEQVLRECYKPILKKHFVFRNLFSDLFLEKLVTHMHEMSLGPGEVIINREDTDRILFFIKEGSVDLVLPPQQNQQPFIISTLNKNQFLGSDQFFQIIHSSPYTALCKQSCKIVYFSLESFLETAKQFPKDLEKYFMTKDKGMWNQSLHDCEICGNGKHPFVKCPAVFFNPKNLLLICKLNKNTPHNERSFCKIRNTKRSSNTRFCRTNVQQITRYYRRHLEQNMTGEQETISIDGSSQSFIEDNCNKNCIEPLMNSHILSEHGSHSPHTILLASQTDQSKGIQSSLEPKKISNLAKIDLDLQKKNTRGRRQTKHNFNLQKSLFAGSDKEFFKQCIQFEFVDNVLQQCSEYESDTEESEDYDIYNNDGTNKSSEDNKNEQEGNNDEKQGDGQNEIIEEKVPNEQVQLIRNDSGGLRIPLYQAIQQNNTNNNVIFPNHIPKQIQQRLVQFQKSISITSAPISPQLPQNTHQHQQSNNPQFAYVLNNDQKVSSVISLNIENPPESLGPSSYNQSQPEEGDNTPSRMQAHQQKKKSKMHPRSQLEQLKNSKPSKKRTYGDQNNSLVQEHGFSQIDNPMQNSTDFTEANKPSNFYHQYQLSKYGNKHQPNNVYATHNVSQFGDPGSSPNQSEDQRASASKKHPLNFTQAHRQQQQQQQSQNITNQDEINQGFQFASNFSPNEGNHQLSQGQQNLNNPGQIHQLRFLADQSGIHPRWNNHPLLNVTAEIASCQNYQNIPLAIQFYCINQFDEMKIYQCYFPSYNFTQVLKNIRRINQTKIKIINQQKKIKKISKDNHHLHQQYLKHSGATISFQAGNRASIVNQLGKKKLKVQSDKNIPSKQDYSPVNEITKAIKQSNNSHEFKRRQESKTSIKLED